MRGIPTPFLVYLRARRFAALNRPKPLITRLEPSRKVRNEFAVAKSHAISTPFRRVGPASVIICTRVVSVLKMHSLQIYALLRAWLRGRDSNQDLRVKGPACCHYTTPRYVTQLPAPGSLQRRRCVLQWDSHLFVCRIYRARVKILHGIRKRLRL